MYYTHQGPNINHHLPFDHKKNKVGDPTSHYFHYMAFKQINWSFHRAIWLLGLTVFFGCLQCCTHKMSILQITPNITKRRGKRRRRTKKQKASILKSLRWMYIQLSTQPNPSTLVDVEESPLKQPLSLQAHLGNFRKFVPQPRYWDGNLWTEEPMFWDAGFNLPW